MDLDYVLHPITVDLMRSTDKISAIVQQNDNMSRKLVVTITKDDIPLEKTQIPNIVNVECMRPDGSTFLVKNVSVNTSKQVEVILDEYITALAGIVCFKLRISANGALHSAMFKIKIEQGIYDGNTSIAQDKIDLVDSLIQSIATTSQESEAYALGTRSGKPVTTGDVAYKNNSKYYADSIKNLTVNAVALNEGATPAVTKTTKNDVYNLEFGIPKGIKGDKGDAATIAIGSVSKGTTAKVTNSGDTNNAIFDFTIPKGDKGDKGDTATVTIGTVKAGTTPSVINSGTNTDAVLDFTLVKGDKGDTSTITIGTVSKGDNASVTNKGTNTDAVFDFILPKGDKGDRSTIDVGNVTKGDNAVVTNTGTNTDAVFDFTLPKGDKGDKGDAATIAIGTVQTVDTTAEAQVTNGGTTNDAVLNFKLPKGVSVQSITFDATESGHAVAGNAGTKDAYKVLLTDGTSSFIYVQNGINGTGTGDMHTATYDTNNNGQVDIADRAIIADDSTKFNGQLATYYAVDDAGNWDV